MNYLGIFEHYYNSGLYIIMSIHFGVSPDAEPIVQYFCVKVHHRVFKQFLNTAYDTYTNMYEKQKNKEKPTIIHFNFGNLLFNQILVFFSKCMYQVFLQRKCTTVPRLLFSIHNIFFRLVYYIIYDSERYFISNRI